MLVTNVLETHPAANHCNHCQILNHSVYYQNVQEKAQFSVCSLGCGALCSLVLDLVVDTSIWTRCFS